MTFNKISFIFNSLPPPPRKIRIKNRNISGRSMIEMLGVLAIIGVLSAGGIMGYSTAMENYKVNKFVSDISTMAANATNIISNDKSGIRLWTDKLCQAKVIPDEYCKTLSSIEDEHRVKSLWGNRLEISVIPGRYFHLWSMVGVAGVPFQVCVKLATMKWENFSRFQFSSYVSGTTTAIVSPVSVTTAENMCKNASQLWLDLFW